MAIATIDTLSGRRPLDDEGTPPQPRPSLYARLDRATLVAAYGAHRSAAYLAAYRILGDEPAAEDAVQEAFLKLWTGNAQFDPSRGSMRGLLVTIARHTSLDAIRRRARRQRTENVYCTDETYVTDGPERATEEGDQARDVRTALVALPEAQRRVIEMAYFLGLSRQQIATRMGIPVGTVKSRMRLGMHKMALMLHDRGDDLGAR
jgi:RNA polymerase sigma-70 factor (ECF subfamily)